MKKRILSLVLCAAMLLSMCLFLGAGVTEDTSDTPAETTEAAESTSSAPAFQGVGPFMTYFPGSGDVASARKAPMLRTASGNDASDGASGAVQVTKAAKATDKNDSDGNPIYQIDLTAQAKSNIVTHSKACDIVLVLDRSGSMYWSLSGSEDGSKERVTALQASVNAFLTEIQKSSPKSRVAIVTYADDARIDSGLVSVTDATDSGKVNSALTTIVDGLSSKCGGGTQSGKGLQQAVNIFNSVAKTDVNYDNTRVTVLFTDGKPGNRSWGSYYGSAVDQGYDVAQQSVHWSVILKHAKGDTFSIESNVKEQNFFGQKFDWGQYGVSNYKDFKRGSAGQNNWKWTGCGSTVYCVGLGLTASDPVNPKESEGCKINEYMYRVSSHRPDGSHVDNNRVNAWENDGTWTGLYTDKRTRNHDNGYYLTTDKADKLKEIFKSIAEQTGEAVRNVTIRDEISESFVPCDVNGTVYEVGQTITSNNGQTGTVRRDESGNYIEWTNVTLQPEQVDSDNNVTEQAKTFSGTLYVKPKDGFLGGNNVPTNGTGSGVYTESGEQVKPFPQPEVNVPIKDAFKNQTRNIYYGNDAPTLQDLSVSEPLASWQTAYVKISYNSDNDISNTQDGTYQVTMTVSPDKAKDTSAGAPAQEQTTIVTSTVNVYKPEITYRDSVINLGDTANYERDNFVSAVWKHGEQTSTDAGVIMVGTAPELTYTYTPKADKFTEDTYVNVTVMANGSALPDSVVKFHHNDCDFPGCSFDREQGEFIVHINVFDLTIQKTAKGGTTIDPNQTFVFKVKNNDTGKTMEIVITGEGQQTIKGLPMGNYTITEDTNWSWKYTPVDKNGVAEPSQNITATDATTVTFENKNNGTNWLTSFAEVINKWIDGKIDPIKVKN